MNHRPAQPITRFTLPLTVATVLVAFAATAWGQPPPPDHQPSERCKKLIFQKHFARYDLDKNGRLDPQERLAMMEAIRAADLAKYDANGNGELDQKELEKLNYDKLVEHFEEMDQNHDAEISRAEAEASCGPLADHFDGADTDHDGVVSWTEFANGARRARQMHPRGPGFGPGQPPPPPPADQDADQQ